MNAKHDEHLKKVRKGYQGRIEWLPVRDIDVEPTAQRPFNERKANEIAKDFDPDLVGYPFVAALPKRGGGERYVYVDGQHRGAAVKIALGENQMIECEVVRGVTLERAAQLFRGRNRGTRPTPMQDYLAGVTANDPECVAIKKIANDVGLKVNSGAGLGPTGVVCAIVALRRIYRSDPQILGQALQVLLNAWGKDSSAYAGPILLGLAAVLQRYAGSIDEAALTRRLKGATGGALGLLGRGRAFASALACSTEQGVSRAIVALYNSGRRTQHLPEWETKKAGRPAEKPAKARVA